MICLMINIQMGFATSKKMTYGALLFLCDIQGNGSFYILEKEIITVLNNISYKYNFIINPFKIYDIIKIDELGTDILITYPKL